MFIFPRNGFNIGESEVLRRVDVTAHLARHFVDIVAHTPSGSFVLGDNEHRGEVVKSERKLCLVYARNASNGNGSFTVFKRKFQILVEIKLFNCLGENRISHCFLPLELRCRFDGGTLKIRNSELGISFAVPKKYCKPKGRIPYPPDERVLKCKRINRILYNPKLYNGIS